MPRPTVRTETSGATRRLTRWGAWVAVAALGATLAPGAVAAEAAEDTRAVAPLPALTRDQVWAAHLNTWRPLQQVRTGWTGSVASCTPGTVSADFSNGTASAISYARRLVGLGPVTMDPALSAGAQQAALITDANDVLDPAPPNTARCWTAAGAASAGASNLALGPQTSPTALVRDHLVDAGAANTQVGHRRWVLNPGTTTMGVGATDGANALDVVGGARSASATRPDWFGWPNAGWFPDDLEPDGRWSFSTTTPTDFTTAQVSVRNAAGTALPLTGTTHTSGNGPDSLVWQMPKSFPLPALTGKDESYTVTVQGLRTTGGVALAPVTYTVVLTHPLPQTPLLKKPTKVGKTKMYPGRTLRVTPPVWGTTQPGFVPRLSVKWKVGGKKVPGVTGTSFTIRPEDVHSEVRVRFVPQAPWEAGHALPAPVVLKLGRVLVAPLPKVVTVHKPTIKGKPRVGRKLRATQGAFAADGNRTTRLYRWFVGKKFVKTGRKMKVKRWMRGKKAHVLVTVAAPAHAPITVKVKKTKKIRR